MAAIAEQVAALRGYLQAIQLSPTQGDLALDRQALLGQLADNALAANPSRWEAAQATFAWFQERYHQAYQSHHRQHQQRLREMQPTWEELEGQLAALSHLNQLAELGPAVGVGLSATRDRLAPKMRPCSAHGPQKEEPICPMCHLQLDTSPPREELAALRERLRRSLQTQQRRLARQAVSRILAQQQEPQLDRLLRAARAADLADLVSLVDEELVTFLRQFLAPEPVYATATATGRPLRDSAPTREVPLAGAELVAGLRRRFPTIEEDQVDVAGQELSRLLRQALAQVKPEPGEKLRLRLE